MICFTYFGSKSNKILKKITLNCQLKLGSKKPFINNLHNINIMSFWKDLNSEDSVGSYQKRAGVSLYISNLKSVAL